MGQPVTVVERPSSTPGIYRFEINRPLSGMGHERFHAGDTIEGVHPVHEVARRIFDRGGIERVHINGSVITVTLVDEGNNDTAGIADIIGSLFTYYRPGVRVPQDSDFA